VQVSDSHLKMAQLPEGCTELISHPDASGKRSPFPLLAVDNVYVLPGVPSLVKAKWEVIKKRLQEQDGAEAQRYHNR
jgi:FAD synthetase